MDFCPNSKQDLIKPCSLMLNLKENESNKPQLRCLSLEDPFSQKQTEWDVSEDDFNELQILKDRVDFKNNSTMSQVNMLQPKVVNIFQEAWNKLICFIMLIEFKMHCTRKKYFKSVNSSLKKSNTPPHILFSRGNLNKKLSYAMKVIGDFFDESKILGMRLLYQNNLIEKWEYEWENVEFLKRIALVELEEVERSCINQHFEFIYRQIMNYKLFMSYNDQIKMATSEAQSYRETISRQSLSIYSPCLEEDVRFTNNHREALIKNQGEFSKALSLESLAFQLFLECIITKQKILIEYLILFLEYHINLVKMLDMSSKESRKENTTKREYLSFSSCQKKAVPPNQQITRPESHAIVKKMEGSDRAAWREAERRCRALQKQCSESESTADRLRNQLQEQNMKINLLKTELHCVNQKLKDNEKCAKMEKDRMICTLQQSESRSQELETTLAQQQDRLQCSKNMYDVLLLKNQKANNMIEILNNRIGYLENKLTNSLQSESQLKEALSKEKAINHNESLELKKMLINREIEMRQYLEGVTKKCRDRLETTNLVVSKKSVNGSTLDKSKGENIAAEENGSRNNEIALTEANNLTNEWAGNIKLAEYEKRLIQSELLTKTNPENQFIIKSLKKFIEDEFPFPSTDSPDKHQVDKSFSSEKTPMNQQLDGEIHKFLNPLNVQTSSQLSEISDIKKGNSTECTELPMESNHFSPISSIFSRHEKLPSIELFSPESSCSNSNHSSHAGNMWCTQLSENAENDTLLSSCLDSFSHNTTKKPSKTKRELFITLEDDYKILRRELGQLQKDCKDYANSQYLRI